MGEIFLFDMKLSFLGRGHQRTLAYILVLETTKLSTFCVVRLSDIVGGVLGTTISICRSCYVGDSDIWIHHCIKTITVMVLLEISWIRTWLQLQQSFHPRTFYWLILRNDSVSILCTFNASTCIAMNIKCIDVQHGIFTHRPWIPVRSPTYVNSSYAAKYLTLTHQNTVGWLLFSYQREGKDANDCVACYWDHCMLDCGGEPAINLATLQTTVDRW